MNRILILVLMFLSLVTCSFAGGPRYSTKQSLESKTLVELHQIEKRLESNPELAITQLGAIIKYSISNDLNQSVSLAYLLMGRSYKELHQPQLALHFLKLANSTLSTSSKKSKKIASPESKIQENYYWDLAEVYALLGDYEKSTIEYKRYQNQISDVEKIKQANYSIALNRYVTKDYTGAIELYESLLDQEIRLNNKVGITHCYSRLAACNIFLGDTEKGLYFYQLSNKVVTVQNESSDMYEEMELNKEIVSKALRTQNLYEEELQLRNRALSISMNGMEHLKLAQTYLKAQDFNKTELSLDQYFEHISYELIDEREIVVIKEMAGLLMEQNKPRKAYDYLRRYEELADTIKNRLLVLEAQSQRVGVAGYQDFLQLEILQKDKEISENTIAHLMRESELNQSNYDFQKYIIFLMGFILLITGFALIYIIRVSKQRRIANNKLALRSLRTQMNPHFIFNALNSVNSFISMSDERAANKFLTEFSTLMRTVMANSEHDFISLTKELEIIRIYLELEHFRFQEKFDYQLIIDESVETDDFRLPPMIIQPFIENAIWHGLRYRETKGELTVLIKVKNGALMIEVKDDGIGRAKSQEIKTKNQNKTSSTALKNISERVKLVNSLHKIKVVTHLTNLYEDGSGTVVIIEIPQPND